MSSRLHQDDISYSEVHTLHESPTTHPNPHPSPMSSNVPPLPNTRLTAFISGPIEYPYGYFEEHYRPLLTEAIEKGHSFVMGPASGTDSTALRYLIDQGVDLSKITVYMSQLDERVLGKAMQWFTDLGGDIQLEGVTTGDRDAAMTRDSDYDILRYMSIQEQQEFYGERYYPRVSATEKNERRRKGLPLHVNHGLVGYEFKAKEAVQSSSNPSTTWADSRIKKFLRQISNTV
ncbi:hypothetical protein GALMADRAFT_95626 [Galerina marginata CBS 339.88]|uniref:Uncharacterized protein n=1 Tax=Galerina marginata (strain CBS 339.88) TaxID=685588 RepID=A0A067T1J1_GALM3|nr:hypothetical protein GALMADRAFT_95626 [Galerina marginata CBS 339.88]